MSSPDRHRKRYQERKAAGLCTNCGKPRDGASVSRCVACQSKRRVAYLSDAEAEACRSRYRDSLRRRHAQRREANLCPRCGERPPCAGSSRCETCRARERAAEVRYKEKWRREQAPGYNGDPRTYAYHLGAEYPRLCGKSHHVSAALDAWAYLSLMRMMQEARERERAAGQYPRIDGLSLLVRECILQHERYPCPVHRQTEEMHPHTLQVMLDERTLALVDAHARRHYPRPDGSANRSAALRDFLIAAKPRPKWVAVGGGPRRYPPEVEERIPLSDRIMQSHRKDR